MSECTDKRYEKLLTAFELGVLTDDEREQFGAHLLECEYCFEKVRKFAPIAQALRHDRDIREAVLQFTDEQLTDEREPGPEAARPVIAWWKRWTKLAPAAAVAVLVLIVLIIKPWHLEFTPSKEAIARENRLAIMNFENVKEPHDPQRLGEITTSLLISDLSESQFVRVVSGQRLYDIFRAMGKEDLRKIGRDIAIQVAKKADARWMLTGNIMQEKSTTVLASVLIDVSTGIVRASQKVTGGTGEDIFALVDKLSVEVKRDLSLPDEAMQEPDRPVSDITTNSREAYRHYLDGVEYYRKFYYPEARNSFERALEIDSTFAMAYYYLSVLGPDSLIRMATMYRGNAGKIDRYYIDIHEAAIDGNEPAMEKLLNEVIDNYPDEKDAYYLLALHEYGKGRYEEAIHFLSEVIRIDPLYKTAYNQMVYAYNALGDFEKALWAIDKYIELAPDEANPYDTRADLYASIGMIDNAVEAYKTALTKNPDFHHSVCKLGLMYIYGGEYDKADSILDAVLASEINTFHLTARLYKAYIFMFQGKFRDALTSLEKTMSVTDQGRQSIHFFRSLTHAQLKNRDSAIVQMQRAVETHRARNPSDSVSYVYMCAQVMAEGGRIAEAEELAEELRQTDKDSALSNYWYAAGSIEYARDNYALAAEYFGKTRENDRRYFIRYMYAKSLLMSGKYEEAAEELEDIIDDYTTDRAYFPIWSVLAYYYLGMSYEGTGEYDAAIEQYTRFLRIWQNADQGMNEVTDAEARLARLKSMP